MEKICQRYCPTKEIKDIQMKVIHIKRATHFKVKNAIIIYLSHKPYQLQDYFCYMFYNNYKKHNTNSFAKFEKDFYFTQKYYIINGQYVGDDNDELSFKSFKQKAKAHLRHNKLKVFL